ncbi:MAG TPA: histone deacetylase [Gemmatimonadales bacterium]|nr:histone deacetylase [Gemmatimonadales bacterium]
MPVPIVWHAAYEVDIGPHPFPTRKYRLIRERLLAEGSVTPADLIVPAPASDEQVALVHTTEYIRKIKTGTLSGEELLVLEVPFSRALREAAWLTAGGSTLAAQLALDTGNHGIAVHLGGGFHHAFPDHGEGFCLINDVAIAIRVLQRDTMVQRAAVVDLDVHHGNGTAAIFQGDPDVFTFSMHQKRNYPAWKPPSDLDIGLEDGTGDAAYLGLLERHLSELLTQHQPELLFYLAGADPYRFDQLGGLGLTLEGLRRRDELVFERARSEGIAVAVCLAGGYALRTDDTVEIHCNTVRAARAAR